MSKKEYFDWIKEAAKEGIRFNKGIEEALVDAAIEEGILPDPKHLTKLQFNIFAEEINKLGERFSLLDLQAACDRAKKVIEELRQLDIQASTMTRTEQEAMLQQQIETLPEELRKLWQGAESDLDKTKEAVEQVNKIAPLLELTPILPLVPPIPETDGYTWDDVFDWFYRTPRANCATVDELAKMLAQPRRTVERRKSEYDAEYVKTPLPDDKSKFV